MKKTKRIACLSLVLAVLMVVSVLPLGILTASAATTATANWYKTDSVLYINDAADLWAFATELQGGRNFAGQTVTMTADVEVNKGMDIYGGYVTNAEQWPLTTAGKTFAGIFDGQGHTISGLYVTGTGVGVGIFGNVATQTTATVKNVTIVNSYVKSSGNGGVGGIFGEIANETTTIVYDDSHINKTKATVSSVYAEINVVCAASGNYDLGAGGIIGGTRSDVEITNTTFAGKVTSGVRGAAAFVGSAYPYYSSKAYYRNYVTIKNSVADAKITENAEEKSFAGALVGYTKSITTHTFENVFSTCTVSGNESATTVGIGALVGGSAWSTSDYTKRNGGKDWQEFFFNNVHYQTIGNVSKVIGYDKGTTSAQKICNDQYYAHATKAGVVDEIADAVEGSLQQSLTLKNNLSLNVYATILDPDATVTIGGIDVKGDAGRYTLDGILPQQMTDTLTLNVTQTILGKTIVIKKALSVRKYCEALWMADFATEAEKDLIADLLRYGEAAQLRTGYKTEFLVTEGMDLGEYGSEVNVEDIQTQYKPEKHTGTEAYSFTDAALSLNNTIGLRLKFVAADTEGLTVSVAVNGKTQTFDAGDFITSGNAYVVDYHKIYAHEMEAPVTANLLKNGSVVATLTCSVADYCKAFLADETQPDYAVVKAMFAYGMSASAYNDDGRLVIIDGMTSDYVIVYDNANAANKEIAWNFARELRAKTGVMLPVKDDTTDNDAKEIIIGRANGRSETDTVYKNITSYSGSKYGSRAKIVGTDIVVVAETVTYNNTDNTETVNKTPELLQEAVNDLLDEIRTHGGDTWSVGLDYSAQIDLPVFSGSGTKKMYYSNENNHTLSITASVLNYDSYVAVLLADGFEEYTTNEINGNRFGTYIKTAGGSDMVAYISYYPGGSGYYSGSTAVFDKKTANGTVTDNVKTQNLRITYGPLTFLPGTEKITASETGVRVTPFIMQTANWTAYAKSPGMCYVAQLLDGSFILVDGGYGTGTSHSEAMARIYEKNGNSVTKTGEQNHDDAKSLYDLLVKMSPDEKPVVAAWFISHAHQDHINLSYTFMERYHDLVDIKMFAHNYPDEIACRGTKAGNIGYIDNAAVTFNEYVEKYYPRAQRWIVHTGQKLYLPGCDIEIFYTPEDFYGIYDNRALSNYDTGYAWFSNGNETSIMFRITLGDTTFMVTGDSEDEICTQVGTRYQNALQSDILQPPHHGVNGPELGFYEYVDPKIVLWSIDEFRFENDARCNGYNTSTMIDGYIYTYTLNVNKITGAVYGPGSSKYSYYANGWLKTSTWTRGTESGQRAIYAVSSTKPTKIDCPYSDSQ